MQTSAAVLTGMYSEMQIQWAVYPLIACLFGCQCRPDQREECVEQRPGWIQSLAELAYVQPANILLVSLTRKSGLELRGSVICYCGLKHITVASTCVMSSKRKLLFSPGDVATASTLEQGWACETKIKSSNNFKSITNIFFHYLEHLCVFSLMFRCWNRIFDIAVSY